jgi:hypothetical protein
MDILPLKVKAACFLKCQESPSNTASHPRGPGFCLVFYFLVLFPSSYIYCCSHKMYDKKGICLVLVPIASCSISGIKILETVLVRVMVMVMRGE